MITNNTYIAEDKIPLRYYYQLVNKPEEAMEKQHKQIIDNFIEKTQLKDMEKQIEQIVAKKLEEVLSSLKL